MIDSAYDEINERWRAMQACIETLCRSLNHAHDEILRLQNLPEAQCQAFDWPEWSGPANSIRQAEKLLGKRLAKTEQWTHYPSKSVSG